MQRGSYRTPPRLRGVDGSGAAGCGAGCGDFGGSPRRKIRPQNPRRCAGVAVGGSACVAGGNVPPVTTGGSPSWAGGAGVRAAVTATGADAGAGDEATGDAPL